MRTTLYLLRQIWALLTQEWFLFCGLPVSLIALYLYSPTIQKMNSQEWTALGTCVYAIGTLWLAFVAAAGLSSWRKQLIGKNEYELALEILGATYLFESAMMQIRNPGATPSNTMLQKQLEEAGANFDEAFRKGRAFWRDEFYAYLTPLRAVATDLSLAQGLWIANKDRKHDFKDNDERTANLVTVFNTGVDNALTKRWNEAVKALEKYLDKYIKR
jgi:hypothetical protein